MLDKNPKIYIAGHTGMVGSSLLRYLEARNYSNTVVRTHSELDLTNNTDVQDFFEAEKPEIVILAAAKVGGIKANNTYPVEFLSQNLLIQTNVLEHSYKTGVKKFVYLGSSCMYPRECAQPIKEEYLLTGPLEPTNEAYAIAKISGLRLAQYYTREYGMQTLNVIPCGLYGTNDHYEPEKSHVITATIKKLTDAIENNQDEIIMWGSGSPLREFMHIDDFPGALFYLMENWDTADHINIGSGEEISIKDLTKLIADLTQYKGKIAWDTSMPDGMPRKFLDTSKLRQLGYKPTITFEDGLERTIAEYVLLKRGM